MSCFSPLLRSTVRFKRAERYFSSHEAVQNRNNLFTEEKRRQHEAVGRIEKIEVRYMGVPKDTTLVMNRNLSTPFDCAKHLSATHIQRSALALLDGNTYWDVHRPIPNSCTLELLHFLIPDPQQVNRAFWRTCSFVLGASIARAFKDKYQVKLHSFPSPDVRSGSFVYDAEICNLDDWSPSPEELRVLSAEMIKFTQTGFPLERLTVSKDLALRMFEDNEYKTQQIPDIARKNEGNVTLYRAGNHVDISKGPMIGNVEQIGRVSITAVHTLEGYEGDRNITMRRFQGVALPVGIIINHMAYGILEKRAAKQNPARLPFEPFKYEQEGSQITSQAVA